MSTVGVLTRFTAGLEGPAFESVVANTFFAVLQSQHLPHCSLPHEKSSSHGRFEGLERLGKLGRGSGADGVERAGALVDEAFCLGGGALAHAELPVFVESAARIARRLRSAGVMASSDCGRAEATTVGFGPVNGFGLCLILNELAEYFMQWPPGATVSHSHLWTWGPFDLLTTRRRDSDWLVVVRLLPIPL